MQRYAFKMFLNPGESHEYRRRHDAIWPELKTLLSRSGVSNYSISLERADTHRMDDLTKNPVMQRWSTHMKDIMAAIPDGSPASAPLIEMFHME